MNEIDNVLRDLEAGLFLQTRAPLTATENTSAGPRPMAGLLTIAIEGHQLRPTQALIGRDFVAWADAQALHIVPGRHASIRVDQPRNTSADSRASFVFQVKQSLLNYLRDLIGQHAEIELNGLNPNLTGAIVAIQGKFVVIDTGHATDLVAPSRLRRIKVPVNNLNANMFQAFK
jgi:hypothetical protein